MKEILKKLLCVVIAAVILLVFVEKYDTRGITPALLDDLKYQSYISGKTQGLSYYDIWQSKRNGYLVFPNLLGRAVVVEVTHRNSGNALSEKLYNKIGPAILSARTAWKTGIPTHLDFWQIQNRVTTLYELISIAGLPTDYCNSPLADFQYETADGYIYEIYTDPESGRVISRSIVKPDGSLMRDEERLMFWVKVILQYLVLAAALSGILVVLLTVPNAIRKRKAKKLLKQEG